MNFYSKNNFKQYDFFLLTILVIDIIFILLTLIDGFPGTNLENFAVQSDNTFAEKFQYLKFIGISIISFLLAINSRTPNFLFFMVIPIYLYWDDSSQVHERFGTKIASFIHEGNPSDTLITNFAYKHIGEILYMSFISFILLIFFLISYQLSKASERYFLKKILKLFIIFGFFSIFVDSINPLFDGFIYKVLVVIEDGGEMISISYLTAFCFKYLINNVNIIKKFRL